MISEKSYCNTIVRVIVTVTLTNSNFDLNCINTNNNIKNNTADQDPPSTFQLIEGTNVYRVTNSTNIVGESELLAVHCRPGDFVLNGGYHLEFFNPQDITTVVNDEPITNPEGKGWQVQVFGDELIEITVHAYCFDNSPTSTLTAASAISQVQQPVEDSPIMSQGIENSPKLTTLEKQTVDSPELSTTEKITKLKTQWIDLLK